MDSGIWDARRDHLLSHQTGVGTVLPVDDRRPVEGKIVCNYRTNDGPDLLLGIWGRDDPEIAALDDLPQRGSIWLFFPVTDGKLAHEVPNESVGFIVSRQSEDDLTPSCFQERLGQREVSSRKTPGEVVDDVGQLSMFGPTTCDSFCGFTRQLRGSKTPHSVYQFEVLVQEGFS